MNGARTVDFLWHRCHPGGELTARNIDEGARFEIALTAHGEVGKAGAGALPEEQV